MNVILLWILVAGVLVQNSESDKLGFGMKGPAIAARAREQIGSTSYPYTDNLWDYMLGETYQGHMFVSDVLKALHVRVPIRAFPHHPILAEDWENKQSPLIAIVSMCWRWCWDEPRPGDIVAYDGIVGIITRKGRLTFSNPKADPPGLVMETDSKYVKGVKGTCWRLTC